MLLLQILYITAGITALTAGLPQMKRLIAVKSSDEFSLQTWVMWACAQMVSIAYTATLGDWLVILINGAWAVFYVAMVALIIYYRPKPIKATAENKL